jgi:hypothetical protein
MLRQILMKQYTKYCSRLLVNHGLWEEDSYTALQLVSELLVLAISDIRKLDVCAVAHSALSNQVVTALVFPHVVESECQRQTNRDRASDDDRDFGWDVIRGTRCRESERTHDVSQTE